jgi:hypothetical protein
MYDRPSYNHIQDSTGSNGALPDAEHDINCPALGQPEYKLNYLSTACESRLTTKVRGAKCTYGHDCKRFRGPQPKKRIYVSREHDKEVKPGRKTPLNVQECMCCHKKLQIKSLQLCSACYVRHHGKGTLGPFEQYRKRTRRAKT